jgi:hypothetical protein
MPSSACRAARTATALAVVAAAGAVAAARPAASQYERAPTRETMAELLSQLQTLLPISAQGRLGDPGEREQVRRALERLNAEAELLDDHSRGLDPGARKLGRNLARDAHLTLELYERGAFEGADFYLRHLVGDCVSCHSRLPADDSALAQEFLDSEQMSALSPEARYRVELATRRFDDALTTLEALFASPSLQTATALDPLTDYLTICIRVKGDLARPVPVLRALAARPRLWLSLRGDLEAWIADLGRFDPDSLKPKPLPQTRALLERARARTRFPGDREPLIEYLVASTQLHRFVATHREPPEALAEAYYLLGTAEVGIVEFWSSRANDYLETAIRTAPHSRAAAEAYRVIEQQSIALHTGPSGLRLPNEENAYLSELRALIGGEQARPSP